jgi:hypothetical protein
MVLGLNCLLESKGTRACAGVAFRLKRDRAAAAKEGAAQSATL